MTDLAIIETLNAVDLFENNTAVALVDDLCKEYRANVYDISDESGRKAVADDAKLINKWSNGLDGLGKDHVGILKAKVKPIDNARKKMRDTLSDLRTEILKPLTDWEAAEKLHSANIQARINNMRVSSCGVMSDRVATLEGSKAFMLEISQTVIDDTFEECKEQAQNQKEESELMLAGIIAKFIKEKAEAARARNTQHKGKINREVLAAIVSNSLPQNPITDNQAKLLIQQIVKGLIPNVSIKY